MLKVKNQMAPHRRGRYFSLALVSLLFLSLSSLTSSISPAKAAGSGWQTSKNIYVSSHTCIDGSQPDTLLYSHKDKEGAENGGTYALNWRTGQTTPVSATPFEDCDPYSGLMFAKESSKVRRFSTRDPQGKLVDYTPQYFARDGSQQFYAFDYNGGTKRLLSSSDGGLTWQARSQNITGFANNFAASQSDARSVYLANCPYGIDCNILFSADAGVTWETRSVNAVNSTAVGLEPLAGLATPVNYVVARLFSTTHREIKLSLDGGRTFTSIGEFSGADSPSSTSTSEDINVYYTGQKLVRYSRLTGGLTISESTDGKTWTNLPLPVDTKSLTPGTAPTLWQMPNQPGSFLLKTGISNKDANLWYTPDGGHNWTDFGYGYFTLQITPYLPTTLVNLAETGDVQVQAFPQTDKFVTAKVGANNSAGSRYFADTGHNLAGLIRSFWEKNGGLAQFGFPQTEMIREYNPADGKAYVVQYFERNRLEYHPELAGTKYEVLLGLLGNQLTDNRRTETPFKAIANPNQSGFAFFPETGHSLAHTFKEYWEANGGLALYGYPISEEFQEVNPDNGKTYTVQYFERNRFEYHAENKGTKYEVLLGLLGNTVLKQKGWL